MNKREAILEANRIGGLVNTILLTVFLVLKLAGLITWPWVWVLAPLWAPVCLVVLFVIVWLVVKRKAVRNDAGTAGGSTT